MKLGFGTSLRLRRAFCLSALGLFLTACDLPSGGIGTDTTNTGQMVDPNKAVTVALLVPTGSGNPNLEALGRNLVDAARLAVRDHTGAKIDLQVYSTGGDATRAASAAKKAVSGGAKIIVGPLFAEAANAVGNAVAGQSINVLSFSNNTEIAGGNVFVLGETFQNKANRIVKYAASKGYKRVAAVAAKNTAGEIAAETVKKAAAKAGVSYTGNMSYEFSPQGISAAGSRIAGQVKSSGTTAIVITADSDSGLPILAQVLPEAGLNPADTKYLGMTRWDIPSSNLNQPGLNGGWFTLPDAVAAQQFKVRFNQAYGRGPHPLAGLSYDGISAISKLLQGGDKRALTKASLTRSGGFRGTSGIFRFNADGTNERGVAIAQATGGTFRIISGAPTSFSKSGF